MRADFLSAAGCSRWLKASAGWKASSSIPALMTHGSVPADVRASLGIGDTLVRLSVGIEDRGDLIADLDAALG